MLPPHDDACFVLFDPSDAPARLYRAPRLHAVAAGGARAAQLLQGLEQALAQGLDVAVFAGFGAADAVAGLRARELAGSPSLELLGFDDVHEFGGDAEVDAWLGAHGAQPHDDTPAGLARWRASLSPARHRQGVQHLLELIAAGEVYQVNYTFALHARAYGSPWALYRALRRAQPTSHRVFARLRDRWILSLSPELFFDLDGQGGVGVRPMKGTAPRHADARCDAESAAWLRADPKNRAENLMILDLLRNDLGRLATPGSVEVAQRFHIEPYATLWQMTSSVRARLRDDVGWPELWRALFPCGSVVGAPKHRAMQVIAGLEPHGRGLYTGAIGWLRADGGGAPRHARGAFAVAIRTLEIDAAARSGPDGATRAARLGIGSGIVADSTPDDEWDECWLKARFATALDPGFGLIETFAARYPQQRDRIEPHLRRLARSARHFGFRLDLDALRAELGRRHAELPPHAAAWPWSHRTRIELRHDGRLDIRCAPLPALAASVDVLLAEQCIDDAVLDADDPLLRHKTTHRARYDRAWRAAEAAGAFDALLFNQRGELCEGGRSSVFLRLQGRWWTPALHCGLLPSVTRAQLLRDARLGAAERVLYRDDLLRAEQILLCNALRGRLPARLRGVG